MRKRNSIMWSVILILVLGVVSAPVWAQPPGRANTPVYYASFGTSLAAGVQADPETCESVVTDISYPDFIAENISDDQGIRKLRHVNFGCPGETSDTFINGGLCDYPRGSQLDEAVNFLHAHGKFTGLITIDVGANDVLACVDGTTIDQVCLGEKLGELAINLAYILETLQGAAGSDVPVVGMNYYNPLLVFWFQDPGLAESTIGLQILVNDAIEGVYAAFGVPVANVAEAYMSYDLVTDDNANGTPDSVELLCAWTWMCSCLNIHPNVIGYGEIANAFNPVIPPIQISEPPRRR